MTRMTHRGAAQGERRMDGAPVARHISHSHYPEDLLELALADSDVIEAMRGNRYDISQDAPATDPASRYGGRLGFGYFRIPAASAAEEVRLKRNERFKKYRAKCQQHIRDLSRANYRKRKEQQ